MYVLKTPIFLLLCSALLPSLGLTLSLGNYEIVLKILRVPAAARTTSTFEELPPNSSLAARRSRARNNAALSVDEPDQIEEILDVRSGARLGPAYLFSDVKWGYGGKQLVHSRCRYLY